MTADVAPGDVPPGDAPPADVPPADTTGPTPEYGTPCVPAERVGTVIVSHEPYSPGSPDYYAAVTAEVADGVTPLTILQLELEQGECRLMRKVNPFCAAPCGPLEVCNHDGVCLAAPQNRSIGTVTVTGLAEDPVVLEPNPTNYYWNTDLPIPLFAPLAPVEVVATGADLAGFELSAWGVPDLVVADGVLTMEHGQGLAVTWTGAPGPWRLYFTLNVDQHGNSPLSMICDVADTGSYVIPASLVDAMLDAGVSGFATAHFYRRTVDSAAIAEGCVELRVRSFVMVHLTVAGHVPCKKDADCPDGKVCNVPINTCVTPS